MYEFHYADATRPPGAATLFQQLLPTCSDTHWEQSQHTSPIPILAEDDAPPPLDMMEFHDLRAAPLAAAAATTLVRQPSDKFTVHLEAALHLHMSDSMYSPPIPICLKLNRLPTLGLKFLPCQQTPDTQQELILIGCQEGTAANRIP